jgi:hypothetical protein
MLWYDKVDPVGPSPVIISRAQLAELIPPWWALCLQLKRDVEADKALGWVLEMWAWTLNAARQGVKHTLLKGFQAEPAHEGLGSLRDYYIYHYTFDVEIGKPAGGVLDALHGLAKKQKPEWRFGKRDYLMKYPKAPLPLPPARAPKGTHKFIDLLNEAMLSFPDWPRA